MELETHTTLSDSAYCGLVLSGLQSLRQDGMFCDYTLVAEKTSFRVHKVLLAAVCEYFCAAFRSGMLEAESGFMNMKGVSAMGLGGVLDFIYTGELRLNEDNVMEVLRTASHIQLTPVINQCSQFFIHNLSLDTIKDVLSIAAVYQMQDLQAATHNFLLQNFTRFARTAYFKQLPLSEVVALIKDNGLKCQSEYKLYKLIQSEWVSYSRENRQGLVNNILKNIRIVYMNFEELKYLLKVPFIKKNRHCIALINKAIYFKTHPNEQALIQGTYTEARSDPYIITFGSNNTTMHSCILYSGEWYPLENALGQPRSFAHAGATVVNNFLYICGGQAGDTLSSCVIFNPGNCQWHPLMPMRQPRRNLALVPHDQELYAIGGTGPYDEALSSMEMYSINNNTWTSVASMDTAAADMTACTHKDQIYVAAGVDDTCVHLKEFKMYDTKTDKWVRKVDLLGIKFKPAMFAGKNRLYLIDLYRTEGGCAQLEEYNIHTTQWSQRQLHGVHFSRCFSATFIGDWLHLVGRNDVDDGTSKRYNVTTCQLEDIKAYPWSIESPLCVVLRIPNKIVTKKMLTLFDFAGPRD